MKTIIAVTGLLLFLTLPDGACQNVVPSLDEKKLKKKTFDLIVSLPSRPAALETGASFAHHARPLKGSFNKRAFDSAGTALIAFLKKRGSAVGISTRSLLDRLSGRADTSIRDRYCLVPLYVKTVKKEKKASVQNVVTLDKDGNFIPSFAGHDFVSRTVELNVRYVIIDLAALAIVWSARINGMAASDDFLKESGPAAALGPSRRGDDQSYRCVMYIVEKVKGKLAREFK